jgi:hypothetical protein
MRKFLVVFLMVALIPFTVGCRLGGLWGFDDEDGTIWTGAAAPTTLATIPLTMTVPNTIGLASIKTDFAASDATFSVYYSATDETVMTAVAGVTTTTLTGTATVSKLTIDGSNYKVKIKIKNTKTGTVLYFDIKVPVALKAGSDGSSSVTITITSLAFDATTGVATITYTVTYISSTTGTSTDVPAVTETSTPTVAPDLLVSKVVYYGYQTSATSDVTLVGTEFVGTTPVTGVDYAYPVFAVYLNKEVAAPTDFSLVAAATDSNAKTSVTLTSASGQLKVEVLSTNKKVLLAYVTGQNAGLNASLNPGITYTVTVTGKVAEAADATKTLSLTDAAYTFTTTKTKLTKWEAFTAAGVSLGSWTTGATATPSVTVANMSYIDMTFDYDVAVPTDLTTAAFDKTTTTAKTALKYTDYFVTPVLTSAKVLRVGLIPGTLVLAGDYTIQYNAGTFKDINGTAVDTTTVVTFTGK